METANSSGSIAFLSPAWGRRRRGRGGGVVAALPQRLPHPPPLRLRPQPPIRRRQQRHQPHTAAAPTAAVESQGRMGGDARCHTRQPELLTHAPSTGSARHQL